MSMKTYDYHAHTSRENGFDRTTVSFAIYELDLETVSTVNDLLPDHHAIMLHNGRWELHREPNILIRRVQAGHPIEFSVDMPTDFSVNGLSLSLSKADSAEVDLSVWHDGALLILRIYNGNTPLVALTVENLDTTDSWGVLAEHLLHGLRLGYGEWETITSRFGYEVERTSLHSLDAPLTRA